MKWLNTARFSEIKINVFPIKFDNNIKCKAESRTMFLCFLKLQYYKSILYHHGFCQSNVFYQNNEILLVALILC